MGVIMNNILTIELLIKSEIVDVYYFETLVNALLKYHIIDESKYQEIVIELMQLLTNRVGKYTGNLSSSVPLKIAHRINQSNLWVLGFYLKRQELSKAINMILYKNIDSIYKLSSKYLEAFLKKSKLFYNAVFKNKIISTDNYFYNSTLKEGILGFYKLYNHSYDAHYMPITVDYNSFLSITGLYGVEYIDLYLKYINFENLFCQKFCYKNIEKLLSMKYDDYKDVPINIFEEVLMTSIILEYFQFNIFELNLDQVNIKQLYFDFYLDSKRFSQKLNYSYKELIKKFYLGVEAIDYINKSATLIIENIIDATKNRYLDVLLNKPEKSTITFFTCSKMNDMQYIELISKLRNSNNSDRIYTIINNVKCIFDVVSIVNDLYFSDTEIMDLFSHFKLIELIALKKYCIDNDEDQIFLDKLNTYIVTFDNNKINFINNNYNYIQLLQ